MSQLYVQTSNVKIDKVKEYIDGLCNTGAKFLVFAYHVDMLKAIESVIVKNKVRPPPAAEAGLPGAPEGKSFSFAASAVTPTTPPSWTTL